MVQLTVCADERAEERALEVHCRSVNSVIYSIALPPPQDLRRVQLAGKALFSAPYRETGPDEKEQV